MRRSELLFILFQLTLKFWRFIFWKNTKMLHNEFMYDKAWIPTRAIHVIKARKTSIYMLLVLHWVFSSFVDPYERFVMLQNQDHVHSTHKCTTPALGVGAKTCFPSRSTQKCFTPTLGVNTKTCLIGFPSTK